MVEIKGRPNEFEAAVIAVVLDQIAQDEQEAVDRRARSTPVLNAWMRAFRTEQPHPLDQNRPSAGPPA